MKIKNILAICACKLLIMAGRLMGKKSSSAPGSVALKISPSILKDLSAQIKKEIIVVCGTNGKTTTNNLLCDLFLAKGFKCVCNRIGANMLPGIACAFVSEADFFGRLNRDYALIECDEASLRRVIKHFSPSKVIVTNLFRDQLDRYGEIDTTIELLKEALDKLPDTELILNGDDPLCVKLGQDRDCIFYGIGEKCTDEIPEIKEGRFCFKCANELTYNYYHYSQLGDYYCKSCGFKKPELNFNAKNIDLSDGMKFDVFYGDNKLSLDLNYRGFYNIYNILASLCAYLLTDNLADNVANVLNKYKPQIGRMEKFFYGDKEVVLNLSKNPAGFNQAIATLTDDKKTKDVYIVLNDNAQDGKDISWIWDVDFDKLQNAGINTIYVGGIRKLDMALRLKYAGLENIEIKDMNEQSLKQLFEKSGEVTYVLINYTALFSTEKILKKICNKGREIK